MTVLRDEILSWLAEGLENPGGLVRLSDPETHRALVSDQELGDCLLLGLIGRVPDFELYGFGGFALTPRGRLYLRRIASARAAQGGRDPRVCQVNPFAAVEPKGGAA